MTAEISGPTAIAGPSAALRPELPTKVVGIDVQRLRDVQPWSLGRDEVVAVAGWYVATAITDCPSIPAIFRNGSLPELRGDGDTWTFCERSGLLYAARPERDTYAGLSAVPTTIVIGVIAPIELEVIGADATEVIVIGRFVESGEGCPFQGGCRPKLMVDHVGWTPGA